MTSMKLTKILSGCALLILSANSIAIDWGGLVERVATEVAVDQAKEAVSESLSGSENTSNEDALVAEDNPNGYDLPVVPGKNLKGRFTKSLYPDMMGDTTKWTGVTKISIPRYFVSFDKKAGQSASASAGWTGPTANVHVHAVLEGINEKVFQEVTDKGYQDFVKKMAAKGYEVISFDKLAKTAEYQTWDTGSYPDIDSGSANFMASGMRDFSMFKQYFRHGNLMNETQAALVEPKIMVNFAAFGKQTRSSVGFQESTASAEVSMGTTVHANATLYGSTINNCDKHGQCFGDTVNIHTGQPIFSLKPFGTIKDTTSDTVKVVQGVTNALAKMSGAGTRSDSEKTVYADAEAYKAAALEVVYEANTRLINKLLAKDKS